MLMMGMITEIQRFSLNDGPGIRTTVFFKGCNMNCPWCHNPETITPAKEIHYYENNCICCYKCVTVCPAKAHKRIGGEHRFFPRLCIKCGRCTEICYAQAMVSSGTKLDTADVLAEIIQDKPYYDGSGGGITISGGEALCQLSFFQELTEACKKEGISTAVETNLSFPYEEIRSLLLSLDLVMCDLKIFDDETHKKYTGIGSRVILDNIRALSGEGVSLIVRTPLIPGITDSEKNISSIADFLKDLPALQYYELLNFNPLGASKYKSLGRENPFGEVRPLSAERINQLAALAEKRGIRVRTE